MIAIRTAAAVAAASLLLGGCGAGERRPGPPAPEPASSGYFVGRTPAGVAVAVDLAGFDPTAQVVSRVLAEYDRPVLLAISSFVNSGEEGVVTPQLTVRTRSGRMVPLVDVRALLARLPGAASLAARRRIPPAQGALAAGASSLRYLGAVDVAAQDVEAVRMVAGEAVVELSEQRR